MHWLAEFRCHHVRVAAFASLASHCFGAAVSQSHLIASSFAVRVSSSSAASLRLLSYHMLKKRVSVTIDITTVSHGFSSLLYLLRPLLTDCQPPRLVLRHKFHTSLTLERGRCTQCSIVEMREFVGSWGEVPETRTVVPETRTVIVGADEGVIW